MKLQMTLEKEAQTYVEKKSNYKISEKLLWNNGGVLFSIISKEGIMKSLFVTSLEGEKINLKQTYYDIAADSKEEKSKFIKCETIEYKEIVLEDGKRVGYIFIIMEAVTPLIDKILNGEFPKEKCNENIKKIKLLEVMLDACDAIEVIEKKYPQVNTFINNEELCLDNHGNVRLLIFDMIKNDINTNNWVRELKMLMDKLAKYFGVNMELKYVDDNIHSLKEVCKNEKERFVEQEAHDHTKFLRYRELAEGKNVKAWYTLGYMHEKGKGTPVDYGQAVYWYQKAAEKNDAKALNNLAHLYQKGQGVEKDYSIAIKYLLQAAKQKDPLAELNLGITYQTGKGVEKNMKKAKRWYRKSMKRGNKTAKRMYERIKHK